MTVVQRHELRPTIRRSKKLARDVRPAVRAGVPVTVVDALLDVLAIDEADITVDAFLVMDLGADEQDLMELVMALEVACRVRVTDDVLDEWDQWTVKDLLGALRRAGAQL